MLMGRSGRRPAAMPRDTCCLCSILWKSIAGVPQIIFVFFLSGDIVPVPQPESCRLRAATLQPPDDSSCLDGAVRYCNLIDRPALCGHTLCAISPETNAGTASFWLCSAAGNLSRSPQRQHLMTDLYRELRFRWIQQPQIYFQAPSSTQHAP